MPQGMVLSAGGGLGAIGSTQVSVNLVTNFNTGESNLFVTGGLQAGWNGAASGYVSGGSIYSNSTFSNSDFSGNFTNASVNTRPGPGGFVSSSPNGTTVVGGSMGWSLLPSVTGGVSETETSQPLGGYVLSNAVNNALSQGPTAPLAVMPLLRQICN
jgi:hypothetical protein